MSHYLITGSSSGIGAALATQLTANGHTVSGVARRKQRLTALANQLNSFNGYAADVGDTESLAYAIRKAKVLAQARQVQVNFSVSDWQSFHWKEAHYDNVVASFSSLPMPQIVNTFLPAWTPV